MELRGHWWNGSTDEVERAEIFVRLNPAGGLFEVEYKAAGKSTLVELLPQDRAFALAQQLMAGATWRRVDQSVSV